MKENSSGRKKVPKRKAGSRGPRRRTAGQRGPSGGSQAIEPAEIHDVLNSLAVGVVKVSKEGRIVYANAHARQLFDMPDRDPIGLSLDVYEPSTLHADGSPCGYDDYPPIKCLRTGELESDVTMGLRLAGGGVRWVTVSAVALLDPQTGKPDSAIVTVVESRRPEHVEVSLRESEDRYRRLVEHAPDAIIVHRDGPILFINDAGVKLYGGRSRDDFIGRQVLDLVPPQARERVKRRIELAKSGEATPLAVQRHVRLDGRAVYVEVTGTSCVYRGQQCVQVICRDVTGRMRAERQLRRAKAELERRVRERTAELTGKNAELEQKQRFLEQMLAVQERDRKLVSYEIHDTILQDVIGALMFLDSAGQDCGADNENARRLEQARLLLRKCIDEARRMISGLRPLIIDEQGIIGGIEYLVNEFNGRGLDIRFTHAMKARRLAPQLESTVFRIVQEALTNLERHSRATRGNVSIVQRGKTLRVEVRDFGVGFNPDAIRDGHYGLEGIKQRARLAGGSATIDSAPGQGADVVVLLPMQSAGRRRPAADE